jgi:hypothetical protein
MRNSHKLLAVLAFVVLVPLSACFPSLGDIIGGGGGSTPASVSGKWSTFLTSSHNSNNVVDLEANFSQSTGTISASQSVLLSNSPCEFGTDSLDGTVKGNDINFTLSYGATHPTVTFSGSVSKDGLTMSGNYSLPSGDCSPADSGTWSATRFGDSSASYSGQLMSQVTQRTINIAAVNQEDSSNDLVFTATLTGGGCSTLNLTGKAIGSVLQLANANNSITLIAQAADPTYATLAVEYTIGGTTCGLADHGTGSLSKTAVNVVVHRSGEKPAINPVMHSLFEKIRELLATDR